MIANAYYPPHNTMLDLSIRAVHTNGLHLSPDLASQPLDSPVVIQRFNALMDQVIAQLPNTTLNFLSIGNEVDVGIGQNQPL